MGHNKHLFSQRTPLSQAVDAGALSRLAPVQSTNSLLSNSIKGGGSSGVSSGGTQQKLTGTGGSTIGQGVSGNPQPGTEGSDVLSKSILDFVNAVQTQGTLFPRDVTAPEQFFDRGSGEGAVSLADLLVTLGPQQFKNFFPFQFSGAGDPRFQQLAQSFETGIQERLGPTKTPEDLLKLNKFADPRAQSPESVFSDTSFLPGLSGLFAGTSQGILGLPGGFADQAATLQQAIQSLNSAGITDPGQIAQNLGLPEGAVDFNDQGLLATPLSQIKQQFSS